MIKTTYQTPELRNANDEIVQEGAFGKNTALSNSTNDGWIDYVVNNLEALHDTIGDSAAHLDGNGHVVEPANLAIGDEDGNRLKTSYLKLTGGTVSGTLNVAQNLKFQDNQENVFGGVYVPSSSATEQYAQFYGGEGTGVAGAKLTLYPDGDGRFRLEARSTDGGNTYTLVTDNNGNLNWRGYPLAWKKDYLPIVGGAMTGNISFNKANPNIAGARTTGNLGLYAGANNFDGAGLQLFGREDSTYAGTFYLRASTKSSSSDTNGTAVDLVGRPNGTLTWGGNAVALAKDYLPLSGGSLTGAIVKNHGGIAMRGNATDSTLLFVAGDTSEAYKGAKMYLYGSAVMNSEGKFLLQAGDENGYKQLVGTPAGALTWGDSDIAVLGTLQNGHGILTGSLSNISVASGGYASGTINFGQTFASPPIVITCCSYGHAHVSAGCYSVTTTSFNYMVSNEGTSNFTNERINWVAIG